MRGSPITIVVTGSECTGKTTLAAWLAAAFGATLSAEYARQYVDEKRTPLDAGDVDAIARGQIAGEDAAMRAAADVVIKDTDLLSTVVYSRHYYGHSPAWIEEAALARRADLYLLLHPDVPWVADGLQRDRPTDRAHMHRLFSRALAAAGVRVVDIRGPWAARSVRAAAAVDVFLSSRPLDIPAPP